MPDSTQEVDQPARAHCGCYTATTYRRSVSFSPFSNFRVATRLRYRTKRNGTREPMCQAHKNTALIKRQERNGDWKKPQTQVHRGDLCDHQNGAVRETEMKENSWNGRTTIDRQLNYTPHSLSSDDSSMTRCITPHIYLVSLSMLPL